MSRCLLATVMFLVFCATSIGNGAPSSGIKVEPNSQKILSLLVTVTSHAETQVKVVKWRLSFRRAFSALGR